MKNTPIFVLSCLVLSCNTMPQPSPQQDSSPSPSGSGEADAPPPASVRLAVTNELRNACFWDTDAQIQEDLNKDEFFRVAGVNVGVDNYDDAVSFEIDVTSAQLPEFLNGIRVETGQYINCRLLELGQVYGR